jgi:heme-degrading monooxygenase HmoA
MATVRLINCFEVPEGRDEEFIATFRKVNDYMAAKPGYMGNRLHRALVPDARYRFINYVEWETAEHLDAARDAGYIEVIKGVFAIGATSTHAIFEIVQDRTRSGVVLDLTAVGA